MTEARGWIRSDGFSEDGVFHGETVDYRKYGMEFRIGWKVMPVRNGSDEIVQHLVVQRGVSALR